MTRRSADGGRAPAAGKRAATNLAENPNGDASHESAGNIAPRSLSSTETRAIQRNDAPDSFRDRGRCKSDTLVRSDEETREGTSVRRTTSDANVRELQAREEEDDPPSTRKLLSDTSAFDVVVNIADQRPEISVVQTNDNSQSRETSDEERERQAGVSFRRTTASPPQIEIVDYDDYVTSVSPGRAHHACSKCTSEGDLRLQVDPFRSPSQSKKNNARSRRAVDASPSSCGRKKETSRGEPRAERHGKDTWHEERLINAARNGDGKKPPERLADFRKEATLRRHYYPEGGWGYVIVTCSMLVHFLGVGLQLAAPGTWHITAEHKFQHPPLHSAGEKSPNRRMVRRETSVARDRLFLRNIASANVIRHTCADVHLIGSPLTTRATIPCQYRGAGSPVRSTC